MGGAGAELVPTAALLAELPGAGRVASGAREWVVAIGLGEDAAPREGELVVVVEGEAEAKRLLFGGTTHAAMSTGAEVVFEEATAEGDRVSVRFSSTDALNPTRLPVEEMARPYDCP